MSRACWRKETNLELQLSYTRGAILPICLSLESADEQTLDLLSSPKAIVLRLRRRIRCRMNAEKTMESLAWKDAIDDSQLAVCWPSTEGPDRDDSRSSPRHRRFVNGELHLRADIKPTSSMAHFRVEVRLLSQFLVSFGLLMKTLF